MAIRVTLTGLFTIAPIIALFAYFYSQDVRREPRRILTRTFLLGLLSTLPAAGIGALASLVPVSSPWLVAAYAAFVVAAIPEEGAKFLVVRGYSARQTSFDEPMDGIVYGVTAALGFAALENVLYVMQGGWVTAILRAVTAVPMHAATGALLGYGIARCRLTSVGRPMCFAGLAAAIMVHGIYDFALLAMAGATARSAEQGDLPAAGVYLLPLVAFAMLFVAVRWAVRTARRLRREQLAGAHSGGSASEA